MAMQGASHFAIGNDEHSHRGGPSKLDGLVALVRVWKRALDDEDVGRLYEHWKVAFIHGKALETFVHFSQLSYHA